MVKLGKMTIDGIDVLKECTLTVSVTMSRWVLWRWWAGKTLMMLGARTMGWGAVDIEGHEGDLMPGEVIRERARAARAALDRPINATMMPAAAEELRDKDVAIREALRSLLCAIEAEDTLDARSP